MGRRRPDGDARLPVFVVSHDRPDELPEDGVYAFSDGIEAALADARSAAGDRTVCVMGGADVAQQYLKAGLIDEISIHLVPVLLRRRPADVRAPRQTEHIKLENVACTQTAAATHLRFRVVR